jgi:hypothetical protein
MSGFDFAPLGWLALALAACSSSTPADEDVDVAGADQDDINGGQTGEEDYGCLPVERDPIALEASSPLGFSGADVLASLGPRQSRTLTYDAGGTTSLELGIDYAGGSVAFVQREFRSDDSGREPASSGMEIAADCADVVELGVTLTFATDDGAFDEAWPVILVADTAGTARVFYVFDPEALAGTFSVERSGADDVSAVFALNLVGTTWTGYLAGQREENADGADAANPDLPVSSTGFDIATF